QTIPKLILYHPGTELFPFFFAFSLRQRSGRDQQNNQECEQIFHRIALQRRENRRPILKTGSYRSFNESAGQALHGPGGWESGPVIAQVYNTKGADRSRRHNEAPGDTQPLLNLRSRSILRPPSDRSSRKMLCSIPTR